MAAGIVTGFFEDEDVKEDLQALFESASSRPISSEDVQDKKPANASATEKARRAAEEKRRAEEAKRRRSTENWTDGRGGRR